MVVERLLDGMQLAVRGKALDRRDLRAVGLDAEDGARLDGCPSSSTVQAPHEDVSQPTFVPVSESRSRNT